MAKIRPIPMAGWSVRAIEAGHKTQTRRPIKPQPAWEVEHFSIRHHKDRWRAYIEEGQYRGWTDNLWRCPYGIPGDVLWVRETWRWSSHDNGERCACFRADNRCQCGREATVATDDPAVRWKPSIHMPRTLARRWLDLKAVRVERVQSISHGGIRAEGIRMSTAAMHVHHLTGSTDGVYMSACVGLFRSAWDDIYAKQGLGFEANPWTWALTFAPIKDAARIESLRQQASEPED